MTARIEETIAFAREIAGNFQHADGGARVDPAATIRKLQQAADFGSDEQRAVTSIAEDFVETVLHLADACVVGLPCDRHGGMVHGKEAEQLRKGVEAILAEGRHDYEELRHALIRLLDVVDACDSLTFCEVTKTRPPHEW
jgi:hypothetical protein